MTIDEAIKHAREVAKNKMAEYQNHYDKDAHYYPRQCKKCAEEHEQLADWLEELKALRHDAHQWAKAGYAHGHSVGYNKSIDDLREKLMQSGFIFTQHALNVFDEIAEQLKAGEKNE